jgi:hypothetical protein
VAVCPPVHELDQRVDHHDRGLLLGHPETQLIGVLRHPEWDRRVGGAHLEVGDAGEVGASRHQPGYHSKSYNAAKLDKDVNALRADPAVTSAKGIYEYLLGGKKDKQLLVIRLFDDNTKRAAYEQQTQKAKADGVSNCPLCALGDDANKTRIYKQNEMDADHVTAWSKGGNTDLKNCQMLCVPHNRAKGNR